MRAVNLRRQTAQGAFVRADGSKVVGEGRRDGLACVCHGEVDDGTVTLPVGLGAEIHLDMSVSQWPIAKYHGTKHLHCRAAASQGRLWCPGQRMPCGGRPRSARSESSPEEGRSRRAKRPAHPRRERPRPRRREKRVRRRTSCWSWECGGKTRVEIVTGMKIEN